VSIDPQPTRQRIVDTATELLAERGVDAVSLSEINRASGQRNVSALQYHFGGRVGLLQAVLAPYSKAVGERRLELIAAAGARPTARQAVEVLVRPQAELAIGDWRDRALTRIVAELYTDPHHTYAELDELLGERARDEMAVLLKDAVAHLPADVGGERLHLASTFVVHAASDQARRDTGETVRGPASNGFVDMLVDMVTGALTAPVHATRISRA
jgi:AcrR family transcriptional regulator